MFSIKEEIRQLNATAHAAIAAYVNMSKDKFPKVYFTCFLENKNHTNSHDICKEQAVSAIISMPKGLHSNKIVICKMPYEIKLHIYILDFPVLKMKLEKTEETIRKAPPIKKTCIQKMLLIHFAPSTISVNSLEISDKQKSAGNAINEVNAKIFLNTRVLRSSLELTWFKMG